MTYHLIEKHDDCLSLLSQYDSVGCNYNELPYKHFSGNFWWTTTNNIKNNLSKIYNHYPNSAEYWIINYETPKYHSLYNSNINHYYNTYPRHLYDKSCIVCYDDNNKPGSNIRIKMICNWCTSEQLCKEFSNMCTDITTFSYNNIQMTWEDDNIDYYVIINKPLNDDVFFIPEKTIVFQMEPWVDNPAFNWGVKTWGEWANPVPSKFLEVRGRKSDCFNNVFWQLELSLNELQNNNFGKTMDKTISTIISDKYFDEGHIKRIDFLKYLEQKGDISLDIFGENGHNYNNYRGSLMPYVDKSQGYVPYKYYFMMENNFEKDFITEKIWEPILCESLCFYYGCPNITEHVDPLSFVQLDANDFEKSYQIIKRAVEEDWWSQRIEHIRKMKTKLLTEMAFFPTIERIIN